MRLHRAFTAAGMVFDDWVQARPWQPVAMFHALMQHPNVVVLDTLGFSGFNTIWQAVLCGAPVVTGEGAFLRGRLGSGILRTLGMHDGVCSDNAAYVAKAHALASDAAYRAEVRDRTRHAAQALQHTLRLGAQGAAPGPSGSGLVDFVREVLA